MGERARRTPVRAPRFAVAALVALTVTALAAPVAVAAESETDARAATPTTDPATDPADPGDPAEPSAPSDPVDPADPTDPADPMDPAEPADPAPPSDPAGAPSADAPDDEAPAEEPPTGIDPNLTFPAEDDVVAAAVAVTVTPDTDLVNGQTVTVAGTGYSPNRQIVIVQCLELATSAADCDTERYKYVPTDGTGAFSTTWEVRRIAHTANGIVDCGDAPGTCRVIAANPSDTSESTFVAISFDPSVPLPPPPTILVGPLTGLVEGQDLALFGSGFPPDSAVRFYQCPTGAVAGCVELGWAPTDAAGGVASVVPDVRRVLYPGIGSLDCASADGACELRVQSATDRDALASVPLGFDPAGPITLPSLVVTPSTALPFRSTVQAVGSGFPGSGPPSFPYVQLLQCRAGTTSYEECHAGGGGELARLDESGGFEMPVVARRFLRLFDGTQFDCASAAGACELVAQQFTGPSATAALEFDPSAPIPPPPTITLSPNGALPYRAAVTVIGTDFPPDTPVRLSQCESGVLYCSGPGAFGVAITDGTGSFSTQLNVARSIRSYSSYPPVTVDCGFSPGKCAVHAQSFGDQDAFAEAPLEFDPSAPIPEVSVTVTPSTGLADFQIVDVHGEGFFPGDQVYVSQCGAGEEPLFEGCGSSFASGATVGEDGTFDTATRVQRSIFSQSGPLECWEAPGTCVMAVVSQVDPNASAEVPLAFSGDPTPVSSPTISIDEPGPYDDGQAVTVRGSGYLPHSVLAIVECTGPPEAGGEGCGYAGPPTQAWADEHGEVVVHTTLRRTMRSVYGGREIDCGFGEGTCRLVVAEIAGRSAATAGSVPITFRDPNAAAAGATTNLSARPLAFTGRDVRWPTVAGGAAMLVGLAMVLLSRRRRRPHESSA